MRKGARGENRPIKTLCALINTKKKQSEHQAEQAELAHSRALASIIKVVIPAFSTFDSQMANVRVGEADHACCRFCQMQSSFPCLHFNSEEQPECA